MHLACVTGSGSTIPKLLKAIEKHCGKDSVNDAIQQPSDGKNTIDLENLKSISVLNRPMFRIISSITKRDIPLSPLHKAIQKSNIGAVDKIISNTSHEILKYKSPQGLTSIQIAAIYASPGMITYCSKVISGRY